MKKIGIVAGMIVLLALLGSENFAQDGFPEPAPDTDRLFYLQRTSNKNTIVYGLNKKSGVVDKASPVRAYWIRYEEEGQEQELSYIQRKFAYGVNTKKLSEGHYRISLTAYDSYHMELIMEENGKYNVYAHANGERIRLNRIFIKIIGGSTFSPDIEYFEINGWDKDNKPVAERMKVLKTPGTKQ